MSRPWARLRKSHKLEHRPRFDCIALLLQGGGALGVYQAGVYEALAEADLRPDWVIGTSIGGINSAIIAGNTREGRVAKLRESSSPFGVDGNLGPLLARGDAARGLAQQMSAITATMLGVPGFYVPRIPGILFQPPGHTRGDELLRYHAAQGDARAPRRVPQAIKVSSARCGR